MVLLLSIIYLPVIVVSWVIIYCLTHPIIWVALFIMGLCVQIREKSKLKKN